MISKSCKYAIRASVYIAAKTREGEKPGVKEVAAEIEAPAAFTAKILQTLNKSKVVTSIKGPYGGFYCSDEQLKMPVLEVVSAIDGLGVFQECVMGLKQCSDAHPCPMHDKYAGTRDRLFKNFKDTSVGNLAADLSEGAAFIKNAVEPK